MNPSRKALIVLVFSSLIATPLTTGCNSKDEAATVAILQSALSNLNQNRSLVESFVRDVKENDSPDDPNYQQALDSYENARDAYNHYLDVIENPEDKNSTRSMRSQEAISDARNTTAQFLADATAALRPNVSTRSIQFQRAVVIPDDLQAALQKLPKKARAYLTDRFDSQVRWRSWGQL